MQKNPDVRWMVPVGFKRILQFFCPARCWWEREICGSSFCDPTIMLIQLFSLLQAVEDNSNFNLCAIKFSEVAHNVIDLNLYSMLWACPDVVKLWLSTSGLITYCDALNNLCSFSQKITNMFGIFSKSVSAAFTRILHLSTKVQIMAENCAI